MAIAGKLIRLVFGGSLYGLESWSIGFHFNTPNGVQPAEDLAPAIEEFYDALPGSGRHDTANLGFIKFNEIDKTTGKYVDTSSTNAFYYTPEHHTTGTASLLPQGAMCVSLLTNAARGRGHAGRVYLPGYSASLNTSGHVDPGIAAGYATKVVGLLNDIRILSTQPVPVVWSKIGDLVRPIVGAHCGDIVDTQRRRRSSLPELYAAASGPVGP